MPANLRRGTASRLVLLSLALGCALAACSKSTKPKSTDSPPPTPNTAANALLLLEWSWDHRDTLRYGMLPTADFAYGWTAGEDSIANPLGPLPWTRDQELHFAGHLFVGGAHLGDPPAANVEFTFISAPIPTADSRPGRDPGWHQEAVAEVGAKIRLTTGTAILISAPVRFFLVRGDSAELTPAMVASGMTASPDRWYLQGWNELNLDPNAASPYNTFIPLRNTYQ